MLSRRRFMTLAAGYVTASAFASACVAPVAAPSPETGAEAAPATEEVTLVYWALQGENGDNNLVRGVIDPFHEQHPDINIDFQEVPWDGYYEKYQTLSAAGQAPDIAFVSAAWIQDFARLGIALNLDPFVEKTGVFGPEDADKYFLNTLDGLRYPRGGSLYAIPYEWVTIVFYYNKDIFDAAGEAYPTNDWTYDQIVEVGDRLTRRSGDQVEQFGFISHWDYSILDSSLHANGGDILNEDYSEALLDSPQNVETVQWWVDLIHEHQIAPLPAEFAEGGPTSFFSSGRVAMAILGVWGIQEFREQASFNWDIAMLPKGKELQTAVQWPNQYAINAKTAHPDEAFTFAMFAIRPDRPADTVGIGKVPVVKSMAYSDVWLEQDKPPANKGVILEMGELVVPLQMGFRWTEWRNAMDQELQLSYLGERPVADSVAAADEAIQAILDRP
ncbi:MAG TPA: sugar ABC transporter substrate-binding protein [Caldilineaceae bacterium]|nr:sugar ABC transporter substrate-binding protein [Caldilineaceae bacterium]